MATHFFPAPQGRFVPVGDNEGGGAAIDARLTEALLVAATRPLAASGRPVALVLEDDFLIASDLEESLRDAGFDVIVCSSGRKADSWLRDHRPDIAIIDIKLADGPCSPTAAGLFDSAVPFVVHSAVSRAPGAYHVAFDHGVWLPKPTSSAAVARAALDLVAAGPVAGMVS